jgi:DHA1 family bicyclomycin/chloramphenicol resistance-like MFS transporter
MRSSSAASETTGPIDDLLQRGSGRSRLPVDGSKPALRFVLLIGALAFFGPLCFDMYIPALPRIAEQLHASTSAVQLSLTTCLIGLGIGQFVVGPLSDRLGRRRPLAIGMSTFVVSTACCAIAPSVGVLVGLRFLQGLGAATGIVISRAVVRDLYKGNEAARVYSMIVLVIGVGPVLAPELGGLILRLTSWRGIFVTLTVAGLVILLVVLYQLPETLPIERRDPDGVLAAFAAMRSVLIKRAFIANALACTLGFGEIFAFVAGAPFVLETLNHLSPQRFAIVFSIDACGLVATSQLNARLVGRLGSGKLLTIGIALAALGGTGVLCAVLFADSRVADLVPAMFVTVSATGLIGPNATALALNDFPESAGAASALFGVFQFGLGAAIAPLIGLAGSDNPRPMAFAMVILGLGAVIVRVLMNPARASSLQPASAPLVELP